MKRIAALLTVYNRCDTTLRCLRELEKQKLEGKILWIHSGGALTLSGFKTPLTSMITQ